MSLDSTNLVAWRHYLKFYRGSYGALLASILASVAQSATIFPIAYLVRVTFDEVIPGGDLRDTVISGLAIVGLNCLAGGLALWSRRVTLGLTKNAILNYRDELLKRMYTLSRSYLTKIDQAEMHASIVQDTERLDETTNALISNLLPATAVSVALGVVLAYTNWLLFLLLVALSPAVYLLNRHMGRRVTEQVGAFHRAFARFSKGILFVLQKMDLTNVQAAEEFEIERQRGHMEELRRASGSLAWQRTAYTLVQSTLLNLSSVVILIVGGRAVSDGSMTVGALLAYYVSVSLMTSQLRIVSASIPRIIQGNQSIANLFNILQIRDSVPYTGTARIRFEGGIALEAVSFRYKDLPVLRNVDVQIRPGSTVALIGPNGSGKSTAVYLILGFYRPQSGRLTADGQPYDTLDIVSLRRSVGVVMQDPIIFPGTIFENITYGLAEASPDDVARAALIATAHDFIELLPEGYDTLVGERGVLLSGGQCQRIALARALLGDPSLLILDEPTNHLDREAIHQLMRNLSGMRNRPSILIVSHDPDVVRGADRVYSLRDGTVERGR
jgi:ATP-binding cassette subfamily B protein